MLQTLICQSHILSWDRFIIHEAFSCCAHMISGSAVHNTLLPQSACIDFSYITLIMWSNWTSFSFAHGLVALSLRGPLLWSCSLTSSFGQSAAKCPLSWQLKQRTQNFFGLLVRSQLTLFNIHRFFNLRMTIAVDSCLVHNMALSPCLAYYQCLNPLWVVFSIRECFCHFHHTTKPFW